MLEKKNKLLLSKLALLITATIWGSTFVITKESLQTINAFALLGIRSFLSAFILLIPIIFLGKRKIFREFKIGMVLGLFLFLCMVGQILGLYYTSVLNSGFISGLAIVFIPLINFFILRKKIEARKIVAVFMSILGLWFITGGVSGINRGDLLTFLGTLFWALYIIYVDRFSSSCDDVKKHRENPIDPLLHNFQQWLVVGVLSGVVAICLQLSWRVDSLKIFYVIAYLSLFATVITSGLYFFAQRNLSSVSAAIILLIEPVSAAFFGCFFGDERLDFAKIMGAFLILLAIMFSEVSLFRRKTA